MTVRTIPLSAVAFSVAFSFLVATAEPRLAEARGCRAADKPATAITIKQARRATRCLINEARRRVGAPALRFNRKLIRAAQRHSNEMDRQNFFAHVSRRGSTPLSRIAATGYLAGARRWAIGENLGYGTYHRSTPRQAVRGWLRSPSHRRAMLDGYRDIGVGVALGSPLGPSRNAAIYTADFGFRT